MPSKSRKRSKGQARKAKAKEAALVNNTTQRRHHINSNSAPNFEQQWNNVNVGLNNERTVCQHGICSTYPSVCIDFLKIFYKTFFRSEVFCRNNPNISGNMGNLSIANIALDSAYSLYPVAVNNEEHLDIIKKNLISNGVSFILRDDEERSLGFVIAFMMIDSFDSSSPIDRPGIIDERDAKQLLKYGDIVAGCTRSLVKLLVNKIPCNCLDDIYANVRTTPKMGMCMECNYMQERTSLFVCTGCERTQYCSKACQIAAAPQHKQSCREWMNGKTFY